MSDGRRIYGEPQSAHSGPDKDLKREIVSTWVGYGRTQGPVRVTYRILEY